ncbi:MAG: class I SAM-dependent methyltransferase [Alphaproteobacteria bacterium]|nr:class I SAM-dependent methyltransferase [Alphaproteobacteria bacterium]
MPRPIARCRACGGDHLVAVLDLGQQPLSGRFPKADAPDPMTGPLALVHCATDGGCGLLQLAHDYENAELFGADYGYRSSVTETMVRHLGDKVARLLRLVALQPGDAVLDIGCNDGTLLRHYGGRDVRALGIDPSAGGFRDGFPADAELIVDFFSADRVRAAIGAQKLKIVTSIAMFYDIADPLDFMRQVRALLADDGVWELEQAYMPAMLEALTYDTVCHEHLAYYGLREILWMAGRADLVPIEASTNTINGGSFRVVLAPAGSTLAPDRAGLDALTAREARLAAQGALARFAQRVAHHRTIVRDWFAAHAGASILGYGASTKGNVLIQHCGLSARELPAILERSPQKYGRVTPGSRIPIISEDEGRARRPDFLFVLPWHFRDEITRREQAFLAAGGKLVFPLPSFDVVGVGGLEHRQAIAP